MNTTIKLLCLIGLLLVTACSSQANQPPDSRPTPSTIIQNNSNFNLPFPNSIPSSERQWEIEIDYASSAVEAIFNFYNDAFIAQGFVRTDFEKEDDDFEAKYRKGSVTIELEIDRDDGTTEVEIDITDSATASVRSYGLTNFGDISIPLFNATIKEIEWDFKSKYDSSDIEAIFSHYDNLLTNLGWQRSKLERDDNEIEADYRKDGVKLELELEQDDDKIEVEIEVNKLRFYQ